jgi:putative ABC transport system ATP-binding protein
LISVTGVSRHFRRGAETVTALDDVSLEVVPGELTVAAGASGSGKTTLLSIIAGYERLDAGTVAFQGRPAVDLPWSVVGFVPQALSLVEELTVAENVDLPARLGPARRRRRRATEPGWPTGDLLRSLEIAHLANRYPDQISGGEQQRTAIGRALRLRPAVLIADEPTGHQDRVRITLVLGLLQQHARAGNVVLISSHDEAVLGMADRVIELDDGRVVADHRPDAVPTARP